MCLVVFAWQLHPDYKLVLAANRDEFHVRPAKALDWWPDNPDILAGRDLLAGGTWLAAHRAGRFATVTNYREQERAVDKKRSRGELVTGFVSGRSGAGDYVRSVAGEQYAGFNLLAASADNLYYVSNRNDAPTRLAPGIYGLSNASLDTSWSKVVRTRDSLGSLIDNDAVSESSLTRLLAEREPAPVPDTTAANLPFELAKALSAPFIVSADYGTRCSTTLLWSHAGEMAISERRFDPSGESCGESRFSFAVGER
jgi:uncharacterized protein with NRDE domain